MDATNDQGAATGATGQAGLLDAAVNGGVVGSANQPAAGGATGVVSTGGSPPPVADAPVKARVLIAGVFGAPNDVVTLSAVQAEAARIANQVDTSAAAVAYAESLSAAWQK